MIPTLANQGDNTDSSLGAGGIHAAISESRILPLSKQADRKEKVRQTLLATADLLWDWPRFTRVVSSARVHPCLPLQVCAQAVDPRGQQHSLHEHLTPSPLLTLAV